MRCFLRAQYAKRGWLQYCKPFRFTIGTEIVAFRPYNFKTGMSQARQP